MSFLIAQLFAYILIVLVPKKNFKISCRIYNVKHLKNISLQFQPVNFSLNINYIHTTTFHITKPGAFV